MDFGALKRNIALAAVLAVSASGLLAQPQSRNEPPPPPSRGQYPQRQPTQPPPPQRQPNDQRGQPPRDSRGRHDSQPPRRDSRDQRGQPPRDQRNQQPPAPAAQYPHRNGKWQTAGQYTAAGSAKEVSLNGGGYTQCKIECVGGRVSLNTVVIRRGGQKQSVTARTSLTPGQEWNVPIDRAATGIRISDGGGGTYKVFVK